MIPIFEQQRIDSLQSGVVILDKKGIVLAVNQAWQYFARETNMPLECIGEEYCDFCGHSYLSGSVSQISSCIREVGAGHKASMLVECHSRVCSEDNVEHDIAICICDYEGHEKGICIFHEDLSANRHVSKVNNGDLRQKSVNSLSALPPVSFAMNEILLRHSSVGVVYQRVDGKVEYINPAAEGIFGMQADSWLEQENYCLTLPLLDASLTLMSADDYPANIALKTGENQVDLVFAVQLFNTPLRWLKTNVDLIRDSSNGEIIGVISLFTDISDEKNIELEVKIQRDRLLLAMDAAEIGIWEWLPLEDKIVWDTQMFKLYGFPEGHDASSRSAWLSAIHPEDKSRIESELRWSIKSRDDIETEFRVVWPDQSLRHIRAQARLIEDKEGRVVRVIGVNWDVTKEVHAENRVKKITYSDELTGISNRADFKFRLNRAIVRSLQTQKGFGVLVMDIDNFKEINNTFGHPVGDALLVEIVDRLSVSLKPDEYISRLGGDEFAFLIENMIKPEEARDLGERIQHCLNEAFVLQGGQAIHVRVSIGISLYPDDGRDAAEIIKSADLAMFSAKERGRNTIMVYSSGLSAALNKKVFTAQLLREALQNEAFELYYQPIISLETKRVIGCEALIRWFDDSGKPVSPAEFIPIAEETGLIYEIGNWVEETSFTQWKQWRRHSPDLEYISVNVSPLQLQNTNFVNDLEVFVKQSGVDPHDIQLEITEGTFLQESMNIDSYLNVLAKIGFRLAIDDFGTGYSSLSYLKRFNVDVIKIDRSFIVDIEHNKADRDIVTAILAMTSSLGFKTVVEGIEEDIQARMLADLGCEYAQGFLFGRPVTATEFEKTFLRINSVT